MVDLDELDRLHAALPELCGRSEADEWSPAMFAVIADATVVPGQKYDADIDMSNAAKSAVTILNAYPALAAEVRALRADLARRIGAESAEVRALREVAEAARVTVVRACGRMPEETNRLLAALAKVPR